jgi:hypothetical protein
MFIQRLGQFLIHAPVQEILTNCVLFGKFLTELNYKKHYDKNKKKQLHGKFFIHFE